MPANALVAALIALMVYLWSTQGLFSSLLNALLTIFAAVIALGLWEMTAGILLGALPEAAWGAGLLLPFGIVLLVLRVGLDTFVGGNLHFSPLIDKIGGAVFGLVAGVVTAGMLVIGIQMCGVSNFFGHQSYTLGTDSRPVTAATLWVPADAIAAGLLRNLSNGSMAPILDEGTLKDYYPTADEEPGLAVHAALFTQSAFPGSRKTLRPENASLTKGGYFLINEAPETLKAKVQLGAGQLVAVVGVTVTAQGAGGKSGADVDGTYRVSRPQIELIYGPEKNKEGQTGVAYPRGYIQNGDAASMLSPGEYAYSAAGAEVTHHWVFQLPPNTEPRFIRVKGARMDLPQRDQRSADAEAVAAMLTYKPEDKKETPAGPTTEQTPGAVDGTAPPGQANFVRVSDNLPGGLNKNLLDSQGIEYGENGIIRGTGTVAADRALGRNLAVTKINHPANVVIVQVDLGMNQPASLLGRIKAAATAATQAPVLVDERGTRYYAMGYTIGRRDSLRLHFDANEPLRALSQIPIATAGADETVTLYYQVQKGITLKSFDLGTAQSQELDLKAIDPGAVE